MFLEESLLPRPHLFELREESHRASPIVARHHRSRTGTKRGHLVDDPLRRLLLVVQGTLNWPLCELELAGHGLSCRTQLAS